jgi:hypothetical protein
MDEVADLSTALMSDFCMQKQVPTRHLQMAKQAARRAALAWLVGRYSALPRARAHR